MDSQIQMVAQLRFLGKPQKAGIQPEKKEKYAVVLAAPVEEPITGEGMVLLAVALMALKAEEMAQVMELVTTTWEEPEQELLLFHGTIRLRMVFMLAAEVVPMVVLALLVLLLIMLVQVAKAEAVKALRVELTEPVKAEPLALRILAVEAEAEIMLTAQLEILAAAA